MEIRECQQTVFYRNVDEGADLWKEITICFFTEQRERERGAELLEPCSTFLQVFRLNTGECAPKSFQQCFNQLLCRTSREENRRQKEEFSSEDGYF